MVQVIPEEVKQHWTQYQPLSYMAASTTDKVVVLRTVTCSVASKFIE